MLNVLMPTYLTAFSSVSLGEILRNEINGSMTSACVELMLMLTDPYYTFAVFS